MCAPSLEEVLKESKGKTPNVWYIEKGVNMIQTDRIKELVEFLRKLGDVKHQQNLFVGAFLYIWKK